MQKQLSKQSQLIDQNFSNEIMLNALAALENLAFLYGFKGKRLFDYYSGYAKRNNEKGLIDAVILQLEIFRNSHSNYSSIYSNYDFPKNVTKEQLIKIIKEWIKYIPHQIQVYYIEIINYLEGYSNNSGISEIIERKKQEWRPTTKEDLERIGRSAPFTNSHMFNQMDKIKENYNKTGNYEIIANLNKNREDNIDMHNLNQYDQKFFEKEKQFHMIEKKIESIFENIIYTNSLNNIDVNSLQKNVELFQNLINGLNFDENLIKSKISLYKSFKDNIQRIIKDKNAINFFGEICEIIISCYKKKDFYGIC